MPDLQKQTHFRLAKTVNGLHGVAHQKQAAPIARFPATGQALQQLHLGLAGVLELVHQQMTYGSVHAQKQLARLVRIAQGLQSTLCNLGEIDLGFLGKAQFQLRRSQP